MARPSCKLDEEDIQELKAIGGELTEKINDVMTQAGQSKHQRSQSAAFGQGSGLEDSENIDIGISEYKEPKLSSK